VVYHAEGSAAAPVVPLAFFLPPELSAPASFRQLVGYRSGLGCFSGVFIPEVFCGGVLYKRSIRAQQLIGIVDVISRHCYGIITHSLTEISQLYVARGLTAFAGNLLSRRSVGRVLI
jgi:hypothetical protein